MSYVFSEWRLRNDLLVWFVAAVSVLRVGAQDSRMMKPETQRLLRTSFHEALTRMPPSDFTPVKRLEDIVNDAYFESRHWMREIFGEVHDPDAGAFKVRHSYYIWRGGERGFDMLRHEYELDSRAVTVTESVGIIDVAVRLGAADDAHMDAGGASLENRKLAAPAAGGSSFHAGWIGRVVGEQPRKCRKDNRRLEGTDRCAGGWVHRAVLHL